MDPICHTLVGATLSRAGLETLTRRATATLVVAANAPDVDIVAAFLGRNLEWRRGLTHGIPALVLWPFIIATLVWAWDRWRRPAGQPPVRPLGLVVIAAIGVVSHPFLDYLNSYGMRWLSPFRNQWFYGDSLFIVDPWLYLSLGAGLFLAGRARRRHAGDPARPARVGLWLATTYIGLMIGSTLVARAMVAATFTGPAPRFMASAAPLNPLVKELIIDDGDGYRRGTVRLGPGGGVTLGPPIDRGDRFEEVRSALEATREGRAYLAWSRFPVATPTGEPGRWRVYDLRYSSGGDGWASVIAPLTTR